MQNKKKNDIGDQELLENFYSDHDNEWLGVLLQRYTLLLLGVCMKYLKNEEDAKDSVQQIFLKTICELHKYKVDYFKSWIYMVTKNHCLMKLRDKGKNSLEITENLTGGTFNLDESNQQREMDATLYEMQKALLELNSEQQVCLTLFYFEKLSYAEIAIKTEFSVMQVKSHIQNGKRNLRLLIQKPKE